MTFNVVASLLLFFACHTAASDKNLSTSMKRKHNKKAPTAIKLFGEYVAPGAKPGEVNWRHTAEFGNKVTKGNQRVGVEKQDKSFKSTNK